jgi:hypothetical protein
MIESADGPNQQTRLDRINDERKHLEGLLKDRINFHLLFATVFMAGLATIDNAAIRVGALIVISMISALIALAVCRTHELVQQALDDLKADPSHPYARYQARAWIKWNANKILVVVPIILTLSFAAAAVFYAYRLMEDHGATPETRKPSAVYQIEDNSDRRVVNGTEPMQPTSQPAPKKTEKKGAKAKGQP